MPNLDFTICHLAFSLGSRAPEGHLYIPPGPVLLVVLVQTRAPCGTIPWQLGLRRYLYASLIWFVLRTRYVRLLSGLSAHRVALLVLFYHC